MKRVFFILLITFPFFCLAQVKNIGTPSIKNFPKSVYNGGTQNWGICQDKNGFIYFANNDGLLCFDGVNWNLHEVSDNSPVRSVFVDSENNTYIGLIRDFGIFKQNETKKPVFISLKHLLPPDIGSFDDIWRIHETSQGIVFQCFNYLFIYKNEKIEVLKPQNTFHFSFKPSERLFIDDREKGIFELKDGSLEELRFDGEYNEIDVSAILETNNNLLFCTPGDGVFISENGKLKKWNTPVNELLKQYRIYCATAISSTHYAFGTILNGLIISDIEGNVVQTLNRSNGIQNNTILSIYLDSNKNLWLGLDNGIDYVEINSPLSFISNSEDLGTGYCCRVFNGNLYLGTNQGLFVRPFDATHNQEPFKLIEKTVGQVWTIQEFDGQLICGHNLGTFLIKGNQATKISNIEGAWKFIRLRNNPDYLLGGHYNGLVVFKNGENGWQFEKKIEGFEESSRFLKQDKNGTIWISHGGKGIFRVQLDTTLKSVKEFKQYTSEDGLPSTTQNILFEFKDNIYFSTINQIYEFEQNSDSFKVSEEINKLFEIEGRITAFEVDEVGNVWYIADQETGVLRYNEDLTYTKITSPFKKLSEKYVNEFEFVYPYNHEILFIGLNNGFAHYTSKFPKSYAQPFQSYLSKIEIPYLDSVLYLNSSVSNNEFEFPFRKNTFRIGFSAPFFENDAPLEFSYFLENFSEEWSDWSTDTYKDFTNLWEGNYLFKLKAKNIYDVESEISTFQFTISPPWHRSNLAYSVYVLLFLTLIVLIVFIMLKRIKSAQKREELRHQQELQKRDEQFQHKALLAEKEIIKLRNDKLRAEMVHRDKELANQTMSIIQKNKFLLRTNEELQHIYNLIGDNLAKTKMAALKKRITREIDNKQQNKIFETYFDEVHEDFFKRLKEEYPFLTPNDLRLCAFIRMNISTKEIATILNISYRGAEISRYRLRKKLELSREINLSTFLSNK